MDVDVAILDVCVRLNDIWTRVRGTNIGFSVSWVIMLDGLAANDKDLPVFVFAALDGLHELDKAQSCSLKVGGCSAR